MNIRFTIAIAAYTVLALLGGILFTGKIRAALWIFLAGLAAKTAIAMAARKEDE